jgi:hypothetical protein
VLFFVIQGEEAFVIDGIAKAEDAKPMGAPAIKAFKQSLRLNDII